MKECYLEINAENLISNFKWYNSQPLNHFSCPMIKANAYGAGQAQILQVLKKAGASHVGVVRLSEAKLVRLEDKDIGVILFNSCDEDEYVELLSLNITPVISSFVGLQTLQRAISRTSRNSCEVHIEIETGMNRLGFQEQDLESLFKVLKAQEQIKVAGLFTHFLQADDWPQRDGRSFKQLEIYTRMAKRFETLVSENQNLQGQRPLIFHVSSSKSLNDNGLKVSLNKDLVQFGCRPGLGLYGVSQNNSHLKTVLTLKAPVIELKWIETGETVSYDGIWTAPRRSLIGTLPIGYGDGYPRALAEKKAYVYVRGQKAPVVGKICMDFMMVDLTGLLDGNSEDLSLGGASDLTFELDGKALLGEKALIFGEDGDSKISLEDLAEMAGVITYEFLTGLSFRMKRIIVEN